MAVSSLSSIYYGLAGACATGGGQYHAHGRDCPSRVHPPGVLRCVMHWVRGRLDQTSYKRSQSLDIITELVLLRNIKGTIKNSDLELAVLVLHEAALMW